jgi:hypothetical protein
VSKVLMVAQFGLLPGVILSVAVFQASEETALSVAEGISRLTGLKSQPNYPNNFSLSLAS